MNFENFIAQRINKEKSTSGSITAPVLIFSMLSIILGMVLMIITVATGTGMQKEIQKKLVGFTGHVVISKFDLNNSYENAPVSTLQSFYPTPSFDGVTHIQKFATKAGILKSKEDFEGVVLKGVDGDYQFDFLKKNLIAGKIPVYGSQERNDSIILSKSLFNLLSLELGDTAQMFFMRRAPKPPRIRRFVIGGVYETGLEDIDKSFVIGDFRHVQRLNRWGDDEAGGFELFFDDFDKMDEKAALIRSEVPFDLTAESVRQKHEKIFQWLDLFDLNIYLIISIMVIVAIIQMVMTLLILILERTRFIGILKTLGASNKSIQRIFLRHAAASIAKGLMWGNILGLGFCLLQKYTGFIKLDQSTYYLSEVAIDINWKYILILNLGTFILCMLALIIPSYMITRINPLKSLRFD